MKKLNFRLLVILLSVTNVSLLMAQDEYPIDKAVFNNLPFEMEPVELPVFPDYSVSITEFGAVGDGITLNTEAINNAIKKVHEQGGGKVVVPEGLWITGPIVLLSNVNLFLDVNALIYFTDDHTQYPIIETNFEGLATHRCQSPLSAWNAENIAITGYGTIDGNGDTWRVVKKDKMTSGQWKRLLNSGGILSEDQKSWYPSESSQRGQQMTKSFNNPENISSKEEWESIRDWLRPVLLNFVYCKKVLLEGVTFKNSPAWCLHPRSCEDITLNKVTVINPWYSQNGDALDLESCNRALIVNSSFDAGDDAICIKSGKNEEGRKRNEPCQNVVIMNNVVYHGHGGFTVGSEMSSGVRNIYVDNNTFMGTDVGLRFKSCRGRGGVVENIYISRINMINIISEAIVFNLFYEGKARDVVNYDEESGKPVNLLPVTEETPVFKNIFIKDVTCKGSGRAIFFNGLPEMRIKNIHLENMVLTDANEGVVFCEAEDIIINNLTVKTTKKEGPSIRMSRVSNVTVDGIHFEEIGKETVIE